MIETGVLIVSFFVLFDGIILVVYSYSVGEVIWLTKLS